MEIFLNERVLYISDNEILSYKRGKLLYRAKDKKIVQSVSIGDIFNKFKIVARLTRREPRCAAKVDENHFIISFMGGVLNYSINDNKIKTEHKFDKGMNNPLQFLACRSESTQEVSVYYGEYIWNGKQGPVSIYKRYLDKWDLVYTFPEKTINHIHNIVFDRYRNKFIVLTGDRDSESGIWQADLEFKSVQPVVIGKQQYRACVAFPVSDGIIYATDTPLEKNYIYHVYVDNNFNVKEVNKEYELYGPCIFGCEYRNAMYFSNSVEPDSSLSKWHYRVTYQLGKGVLDNATHLIKRNENGVYEEIASIQKDKWPMWLFQFGNILFPQNESSYFYGVLQASSQGHGVTVKFD